jgi:hypothetical protein
MASTETLVELTPEEWAKVCFGNNLQSIQADEQRRMTSKLERKLKKGPTGWLSEEKTPEEYQAAVDEQQSVIRALCTKNEQLKAQITEISEDANKGNSMLEAATRALAVVNDEVKRLRDENDKLKVRIRSMHEEGKSTVEVMDKLIQHNNKLKGNPPLWPDLGETVVSREGLTGRIRKMVKWTEQNEKNPNVDHQLVPRFADMFYNTTKFQDFFAKK